MKNLNKRLSESWDSIAVLMVEFMQRVLRRADNSEQKAWNADTRCSTPP
jgi:hypothetical protein